MKDALFTEDPAETVDYDKFYAELTGGLSTSKMACVHEAFVKLDT